MGEKNLLLLRWGEASRDSGRDAEYRLHGPAGIAKVQPGIRSRPEHGPIMALPYLGYGSKIFPASHSARNRKSGSYPWKDVRDLREIATRIKEDFP